MIWQRYLFAVLVACVATGPAAAETVLPPIRHVFVIVLENSSYSETFGPHSLGPYLAKELPRQGALLENYYAIGHSSLDNYIAMISGQPPNEDTQEDCGLYSDFVFRKPGLDAKGRAIGHGCVYPSFVPTLPAQLDAAHLSWRGYMEDMGKDPARESATCGHSQVGSRENLLIATHKDEYAVKHNPFMYFHAIIDRQAYCDAHVVNFDALKTDLRSIASTPNFSYIVPNLCHDGHDSPCIDQAPGGLLSSDPFLMKLIPTILNSPAFRKDGLLIVTLDEAGSDSRSDSDACCGEEPMPGAKFPPGGNGPGGGRIGAVVLSPFIEPGTVSQRPYNHYSLLRSIEDIFGLKHLALAAGTKVKSFGTDVFTKTSNH